VNHEERTSIKPYDPDVFDRLNLFRTAKTLLYHNKGYIRNLGDVIVTHQLHERFGVCLLHKHFEQYHDEIVVRTIDPERRLAHMRPTSRHTDAVPYLWRALHDSRGRLQFVPLEYIRRGDERESQVTDLEQYAPFLAAMAHALAERELLDVFGIATTNIMSIPVAHDELMVETTDSENRILTITPEHRSNLQIEELTETFWTFLPGPLTDLGEVAFCSGMHCNSHCKNHCIGHCKSHCKDHPDPYSPEDVAFGP